MFNEFEMGTKPVSEEQEPVALFFKVFFPSAHFYTSMDIRQLTTIMFIVYHLSG